MRPDIDPKTATLIVAALLMRPHDIEAHRKDNAKTAKLSAEALIAEFANAAGEGDADEEGSDRDDLVKLSRKAREASDENYSLRSQLNAADESIRSLGKTITELRAKLAESAPKS